MNGSSQKIDGYTFQSTIKQLVNDHPTEMYARINKLWPNELQKFEKGYETVDSSKTTMRKFLERKGNAIGFEQLLQKL